MRSLQVACIVVCSMMPAFGAAITGTFEPPTGDLGTTHTYVFSGWSIVATAFQPGCTTACPDLFGKAGGAGETGLGLTNDPASGQNEITPGSFIQLDLFIFNPTPSTHLSPSSVSALIMDSTTSPDAFKFFQSGTSGVLGTCSIATPCWTGTSNGSVSISPTLRYLDITATAGNVLLNSIAFDTGGGGQGVPEPLSLGLTGIGLVAIYFARRLRSGPNT